VAETKKDEKVPSGTRKGASQASESKDDVEETSVGRYRFRRNNGMEGASKIP
jgi:hypothetical protein